MNMYELVKVLGGITAVATGSSVALPSFEGLAEAHAQGMESFHMDCGASQLQQRTTAGQRHVRTGVCFLHVSFSL